MGGQYAQSQVHHADAEGLEKGWFAVSHCPDCADFQELIFALQDDLRQAHREYTRLRDLLIQNGISLEENDGTDEGCTEGLSL